MNMTLQKAIDKENNNKHRQNPKEIEKCEKKVSKPFKPLPFL